MYEKLTWKPLETNSLADILTMQTGCTHPITVTPAYTPASITVTGNTPPALVPNKALISLTATWNVTLNSDNRTKVKILVIQVSNGNALHTAIGGETNGASGTFTTSLPLNIVAADTTVYVRYSMYANPSATDETQWYNVANAVKDYSAQTLVAYKPATSVITGVTPPLELVKDCTVISMTYSITLNHDKDAIAFNQVFNNNNVMISYATQQKTLDGDYTNNNTVLSTVAYTGTCMVNYIVQTTKPDNTYTATSTTSYVGRTLSNYILPVHASCGTMPSTVTIGSDVVVPDVTVTGGNCVRKVYFSVLKDGSTCKAKTVEGDIVIPANYPTNNKYSITVPSLCLPLGGPYNIKIVMNLL